MRAQTLAVAAISETKPIPREVSVAPMRRTFVAMIAHGHGGAHGWSVRAYLYSNRRTLALVAGKTLAAMLARRVTLRDVARFGGWVVPIQTHGCGPPARSVVEFLEGLETKAAAVDGASQCKRKISEVLGEKERTRPIQRVDYSTQSHIHAFLHNSTGSRRHMHAKHRSAYLAPGVTLLQ